ncbi:CAMK family protein kinase [Tritrichomonas foetus]|uniref:CAMK family protein kinase n=1 Tax=Tritrichomonas foetus TaxID=1144522 RepID=A0A1J4KGQ4_9EUKA|nr:CAMK family protein kinase [Tritrichomonas foetus]|eukprot:OHT08980.1 CAMK family protein kinase [Tritrichomonas foetus]
MTRGSQDMSNCITHPTLGEFRVVRMIGDGACATVSLGFNKELKFMVAFKVFHNHPDSLKTYEREVELLQSINHPFINNYFDAFEYNGRKIIMLEFIDGLTLLEKVNTWGVLDENQARVVFIELIQALKYLHKEKKIVHRDIKCENIMIDSHGNIKLIDFGFAHSNNSSLQTSCGSLAYIAPEIIIGNGYTEKVDIWSAGIVLYAITCGHLPFDTTNSNKLLNIILNDEPEYPAHMSINLSDLLSRILKKDPSERITLEEIEHHPWFTMDSQNRPIHCNYDLLEKLKFKKGRRSGSEKNDILQKISEAGNASQALNALPLYLFPIIHKPLSSISVPRQSSYQKCDPKSLFYTKLGFAKPTSERKVVYMKKNLIMKPAKIVPSKW